MARTHQLSRYCDGRRLNVIVDEGSVYEIKPEKAGANSRHYGRICRIEALQGEPVPRQTMVRYQDTGRIGIVRLADLEELEPVDSMAGGRAS